VPTASASAISPMLRGRAIASRTLSSNESAMEGT
jgi:hypothetical protein